MPVTVQQALHGAQSLKLTSDISLLDTELILSHVLNKSREYIRAHSEEEISETSHSKFQTLLDRRHQGEPVAYIIGRKAFWDFELTVNESVLVPRPETEILVELCLAKLRNERCLKHIADLGTGSGAIAIALALENPDWQVHATDISEDALAVARDNAQSLDVSNIVFHQGSWCGGLPAKKFDFILANPPYVEFGDKHLEEGSLPFEPTVALVAEEAGFGALKSIMNTARKYLKKDSWLLMEHGYSQQSQLIENLIELGYEQVAGHKDFAGIDRIVEAKWTKVL
ncbi:MAG: peptide chain release factor N(5)-glutamine methyltransferase [Pseudomonadota bacterium]|nr:peptide chain release factor N(5)-glutamine methyltransferase [Pseudomonadota bacterium]